VCDNELSKFPELAVVGVVGVVEFAVEAVEEQGWLPAGGKPTTDHSGLGLLK
jgi:hypothetical protein